MKLVEGKVAIITGASSGIGEATALVLAKAGVNVVLAARRRDRLEDLQRRIEETGSRSLVVECDVSKEDQAQELVKRARETFGHIDILVNNAGAMLNAPLDNADVADWRRMLDLNVYGLAVMAHAVWPLMKTRGGGHIINISSVAARSLAPGAALYAGTKGAVNAFSEVLRKEGIRHRIRVSVIAPGMVSTELQSHIPDAELKAASDRMAAEMEPLQPRDIANAVLYVATQPDHVSVNELVIRPSGQER